MIGQIKYAEKALTKISEQLTKMCHLKGCDSYICCPESCPSCVANGNKLDLDTAIAWNISSDIAEFFEAIEEANDLVGSFNSEWVKYKNPPKKYITSQYYLEEMEGLLDELKVNFEDLLDIRTAVTTCQRLTSMHFTKYFRIHTKINRTDELMGTAITNVTRAMKRCNLVYSELKSKHK